MPAYETCIFSKDNLMEVCFSFLSTHTFIKKLKNWIREKNKLTSKVKNTEQISGKR